jgi:catechol 2,3-dioxygenase-like lactoylglutathione lyase family enzyme
MTLKAALKRLVVSSPDPARLGDFYARVFDYRATPAGEECRCEAEARSLWIRRGSPNGLLESHFAFRHAPALERYAAELRAREVPHRRVQLSGSAALVVTDPEGREVWFRAGKRGERRRAADIPEVIGTSVAPRPAPIPARLQHYAVRTPAPQALADFYVEQLGFVMSDTVRDAGGELAAAFLRTDAEHHAVAIFKAAEPRFDHFSCETRSWRALRDWADRVASRAVNLAWGIGRHGPGNDTFFMVADPDGNLAEISSDLEVCAEDRPAGLWELRPETLNRWGIALARS